MPELYHCMYKEPEGEAILASCFRDVNGEEKSYVFAATHLTKSLAFAFSYHANEVLFNSGIGDTPNELVVLCGGQKTLDRERSIKVFAFPDDGFTEISRGRQAVSENAVPFSQTRIVMETTDINDLMKEGLQIFLLPEDVSHYLDENGNATTDHRSAKNWGEAMAAMMRDNGARWINQERNINICPQLTAEMGTTNPSSSREGPPQGRPVLPSP